MGVESDSGFERITFSYQCIKDNVGKLDDATVKSLNEVIVKFGHDVFKKRRGSIALKNR